MLRLDAYKLKWIAIVGMILNHMVIAWYEILPYGLSLIMYAAGGLTFPILGYFVVEGYKHTSNLKRYILRLLIFAVIAAPFHFLAFRMLGLNILFTIILSLVILLLNDKLKNRFVFWLLFVVFSVVSVLLLMDWYIIGLVMVFMFYKIKNETIRRVLPPIIAGVFWFLLSGLGVLGLLAAQATGMEVEIAAPRGDDIGYMAVTMTFIVGCIFGALLLKGYNGERGRKSKWLFYIIYPVHLAVLGIVALGLGLFSL